MAKTYTVKQGDTIQDAAFNVSGSLAGIDPILEKNTPTNIPPADWKAMQYHQEPPAKNFMESYTPALRTNQILDVEGIDTYNLQTLQRPPFNSSMDVNEEVEVEISRLFKATAEGGRALISALAPEAMGAMKSTYGNFLRDTFYNSPYTVQCLFRTSPKYKYTPNPKSASRVILDTSGSSNFPRIDITNPSKNTINLALYNNRGNMYSTPVFWDYLYSIVFISDGAKVYVYINNEPLNYQNKNWVNYTSYLYLGGYGVNNRPAVDFMGEVICARWFDRALTKEEMEALQNGVRPQDYIVPPALKLSCVAEYIPQNLIPSEDDSSKPAMWLDSAKQMPPDISTPPFLRKSAGGYDLVVNDNPKIGREPIYKPTNDFKGVYTANGAFTGQRISTQSLTYGTLECYFKTGDDIRSEQCIFNMSDNLALPRLTILASEMRFSSNDHTVLYPCEPNTTYHVVLRYAIQEDSSYIFVNGIKISGTFKLGSRIYQRYFNLGMYAENIPILLKGEIYHFRNFNTFLTEAQALMLWNEGDPASFVVDAAMKASCTREYLPQNIQPRSDDPTKAGYWWSSHKQMPVNGVLEPLSDPPAEWPNTNLDYYNYPSIIKR
jgi:hypothetical protein